MRKPRNKHQIMLRRMRFRRRLPPNRVGRSPHPSYAEMVVRQCPSGLWMVVEPAYDRIVIDGFLSNSEAWDWIDRNTFSGRDDVDRHHRIGSAFSR